MNRKDFPTLPQIAQDYIDSVIGVMKYRKSIRREVRQELTDHFTDALSDCKTDEEAVTLTKELIAEFGDARLLGALLRRGKKRCRPLWQKTALALFKVTGVMFLLLAMRIGYMATGRPTVSIDYTQWMNDKVRNARDESLNAWHDYQKAVELITKDLPPEIQKIEKYTSEQEKTPEDWKAIEEFLKTETKAIDAFRRGAAKPYYWSNYQRTKGDSDELAYELVGELVPHLSGYKRLARHFLFFQIPFELHQGNQQKAINDGIALCKFGKHLSNKGTLIENLVGVAIDALAWSVVYDLLAQTDISVDDLLQFQTMIESNYEPATALINWELEKAFWYDQVQRMFTDNGSGNGRPLLKGTLLISSDSKDYIKGLLTGFPDRKEAIESIDEIFAKAQLSRTLSPLQLTAENNELEELFRIFENSGIMQKISFPAIDKTLKIGWRSRTGQAGLISTLSILRFEKKNGRLPEDWHELLENGYLKTIPMDPYSGKPLVYRMTDDGFTLYSVGQDFKDDGGRIAQRNGGPNRWGDNGDAVFWPENQ